MATNFPNSLDSLNNPASTDTLGTPGVVHSTQHDNINDAVEAIQEKIGVNNSTDHSSLDYRITQVENTGNSYAPKNSPTFTGTVTFPSGTSGANLVNIPNSALTNSSITINSTSVALGGSITGIATLASPTFTGTVTIPAGAPISGYLTTSSASSTYAPINNPTFTGAVTLAQAPTSDLHAVTKRYVDNLASGVNAHDAVKCATTTNLSGSYVNGSADQSQGTGIGATFTMSSTGTVVIDGYTTLLNDRVLIKDQTDAKQNGIYYVSTVGTTGVSQVFTRSTDMNNNVAGQMNAGDMVFVLNGTQNINQGWLMNSTGTATTPAGAIKIGTDNINWTQFNGASTIIAGSGILKNANTLSVDTSVIASLTSPTFTGTVTLPSGTSGANLINIPNSGLTNSSITINGSPVSLGSSVDTNPYKVSGTIYGVGTAGTATISLNSATTVDTYAVASYTSSEYTIQIKQGAKYRASKILLITDGTNIYTTEYAIVEIGSITGIDIGAIISSSNVLLQVTITDAATTNATVKFLRNSIV